MQYFYFLVLPVLLGLVIGCDNRAPSSFAKAERTVAEKVILPDGLLAVASFPAPLPSTRPECGMACVNVDAVGGARCRGRCLREGLM